MWKVILESSPDRGWLRGFGLALAVLAGSVAFLVAWLAGWTGPSCVAAAAGLAGMLGAVAWRRPHAFETPYELWNRGARAYAVRVRKVVLTICYYSVVLPAGAVSGALVLRPIESGESGWVPHRTLPREEYAGQGSGRRSTRDGVAGDLAAWARASGRPWVLLLVPHLLLIAALDTESAPESADGIYTLY